MRSANKGIPLCTYPEGYIKHRIKTINIYYMERAYYKGITQKFYAKNIKLVLICYELIIPQNVEVVSPIFASLASLVGNKARAGKL